MSASRDSSALALAATTALGLGLCALVLFHATLAPSPPQLPPTPPPPGIREITGSSIQLVPETRYLDKAQVTGLATWLVGPSAIEGKLREMGFALVTVYTYFVEATYQGAPQSIAVPSQVKRVWVAT